MIKIKTHNKARIAQGDIYKDVEFIEYAEEKDGIITISKIAFPFVIVLTQDCDLDQDYTVRWSKTEVSNQDKKLLSVIVAPLYNAEHFNNGEHLSELKMEMAKIKGNTLKQNKNPRYQYIEFPEKIPIVPSIIDFKHYFSVNVEYLKRHKKENFVCQINALYREDISQRFSSFLSRIGLPRKKKT
jgi:hypothetical protein